MYKPEFAVNLNKIPSSLLRLALVGPPHTGKTWAAMSFPNPVVFDFDDKLGAHRHRDDILVFPFYDPNWVEERCKAIGMRPKDGGVLNAYNLLLYMCKNELKKFSKEQTVIFDSFSSIQDAFDSWGYATPETSKNTGEVNTQEFWGRKFKLNTQYLNDIKTCPANVIVTFHQTRDVDKLGNPTGKYNALAQGSTRDKLGQYFTDWYRTYVENEVGKDGKIDATKTKYLWQIAADNNMDCCCSIKRLVDAKTTVVPAGYRSLFPEEAGKTV